MKLNNTLKVIVLVLFMAFMLKVTIGVTKNERYNDAVEVLERNGSLILHDNGSATYVTPWETERETLRALNEVSKRHEIILHTI